METSEFPFRHITVLLAANSEAAGAGGSCGSCFTSEQNEAAICFANKINYKLKVRPSLPSLSSVIAPPPVCLICPIREDLTEPGAQTEDGAVYLTSHFFRQSKCVWGDKDEADHTQESFPEFPTCR